MTRDAGKEEILAAFAQSPRIVPIDSTVGFAALNSVKEWMADLGRPHDNLYEVALWADSLAVRGNELFYTYMVDNQAIIIPETIDAIRALAGTASAGESMRMTNETLGIGKLR